MYSLHSLNRQLFFIFLVKFHSLWFTFRLVGTNIKISNSNTTWYQTFKVGSKKKKKKIVNTMLVYNEKTLYVQRYMKRKLFRSYQDLPQRISEMGIKLRTHLKQTDEQIN